MASSLNALYNAQGFVVVPNLIAAEDRTALEDACKHITSRTRSGHWPHRRTVGKQFPPYGDSDPDSWGVQHIMHPELGEPIFARWYTSDRLIEVVKQLLDCAEDDLQMDVWRPNSKFNLWHRGADTLRLTLLGLRTIQSLD